MQIQYIVLFLFLSTGCFAASQNTSSFKIECRHAFNIATLDLARILPLQKDTEVTVNNAHTTELFVISECCENIAFGSQEMTCSRCSENGIKVCNFTEETIIIKRIVDVACKRNSKLLYSCTSQNCLPRNNTENLEVYRPGDDTGCVEGGKKYVCSKYGNWTEKACQDQVETTTNKDISTETTSGDGIGPTSTELDFTTDLASPSNSTEEFFQATSQDVSDAPTTSSNDVDTAATSNYSDTPTTQDTLNITDLNTVDISSVNGSHSSNGTTTDDLDTEKAMKALYTFLIVLGVVLFLVFIIVCIFFIRKQKDKISISHVDYPLEYWHDKEYIDTIVEKNTSPKSSYTLNPVFDNKGYVQRYKKKDESDYKKRRNNTTKESSDVGVERARRSNAFRTRSNDSASCQGNPDHPRRKKNNYTDKYIATAVGSNFYNYSPSQSQDVVTKTTDLDVSMEDEIERPRGQTDQSQTSSFKPITNNKEQHKRAAAGSSHDPWDDKFADVDLENMYGVNYKEHLRRSLDYWSAEESDA